MTRCGNGSIVLYFFIIFQTDVHSVWYVVFVFISLMVMRVHYYSILTLSGSNAAMCCRFLMEVWNDFVSLKTSPLHYLLLM